MSDTKACHTIHVFFCPLTQSQDQSISSKDDVDRLTSDVQSLTVQACHIIHFYVLHFDTGSTVRVAPTQRVRVKMPNSGYTVTLLQDR